MLITTSKYSYYLHVHVHIWHFRCLKYVHVHQLSFAPFSHTERFASQRKTWSKWLETHSAVDGGAHTGIKAFIQQTILPLSLFLAWELKRACGQVTVGNRVWQTTPGGLQWCASSLKFLRCPCKKNHQYPFHLNSTFPKLPYPRNPLPIASQRKHLLTS